MQQLINSYFIIVEDDLNVSLDGKSTNEMYVRFTAFLSIEA